VDGAVSVVVVRTDSATTQGQSNDNVAKRVQGNLIQQLYERNGEVHTASVDSECSSGEHKMFATGCLELTGKWKTDLSMC
jgi:hypothetical protein